MLTLPKVTIGLALLLAIVGCGSGASEPLPDSMIQVWRNPAPGYRDRYFELRKDWVLFGISESKFKMHRIETVRSEPVGNTTEFEIEYQSEDGDAVPVHLVYTPGSPPHLRIGARRDLWVPEKFADWLKEENS